MRERVEDALAHELIHRLSGRLLEREAEQKDVGVGELPAGARLELEALLGGVPDEVVEPGSLRTGRCRTCSGTPGSLG